VAARKNDLLGTLADTCRAKRLLHFQSQYNFISSMKGMIADAVSGKSDYFSPMWDEPSVKDRLEQHIPDWKQLAGHERNARLRAVIVANRSFQRMLETI